jgi:hypothetical protein
VVDLVTTGLCAHDSETEAWEVLETVLNHGLHILKAPNGVHVRAAC